MNLNNQKLRDSLIKYYYMEKQYTLKQISSLVGLHRVKVSAKLKELGIDVVPDTTLQTRLKLGFHLHHRVLLPFTVSAKTAGVSVNTLREFFNEKQVRYRPSSYEKLMLKQQEMFRWMWQDNRVYEPTHVFAIPADYSSLICNRIGDDIIELYSQGISIYEMRRKVLIPLGYRAIVEFLRFNNIEIKMGEEYTRLYTVNEKYFYKIDTEEKAYWLGFIMGDGCVHGDDGRANWGLSIALQARDKNQLVKFKGSIEATNPIYSYLVDKKYPTCAISIQNTPLAKSLEFLGVVRNKSLTAQLPSGIPSDLMSHFIRGLFDADGSIPKSKGVVRGISICGTPELISQIMNIMQVDKKYLYIREDLSNFGELRCHKINEAIRVLDYIYKDATIYMDRKHKRYKELHKRKIPTGEGVETNEITA